MIFVTDDSSEGWPAKAISDAVGATGLPATFSGKIKKAVFRLIAGGIGFEYFQQIRENIDTVEGRTKVNAIIAEEVGRRAISDPQIMERAKARLLGEWTKKQTNLEAVAKLAYEKSESDPTANEAVEPSETEPTDDWMNSFIRSAEDASSDELRGRLASVLAGEAKEPGTFSRATVRFIAEVDKETLDDFNQLLTFRAGNMVVRGENWNTGEWFVRANSAESVGLVTGSGGFTTYNQTIDSSGFVVMNYQDIALVTYGEPKTELSISVLNLTRLGREVADLLGEKDRLSALKHMAEQIERSNREKISKIVAGPILTSPDGNSSVPHMYIFWDKSHQT